MPIPIRGRFPAVLARCFAAALAASSGAAGLQASSARADPPPSFICNPFPPQKIQNGAPDTPGIDIELIQDALRRSGRAATFGFAPWKRAYQLAAAGEYSGLCSCSYRAERTKDFLFSDELGEVAVGFFTKISQPYRPQSIDDLKTLAVGVVRGYNLSAELDDKGIPYVDVTEETGLVKMLELNRIDVAFSFHDTFLYDARKLSLPSLFSYRNLRTSPYFVCVSRARPGAEALLSALNAGLAEQKADGTADRIRAKYLSAQPQSGSRVPAPSGPAL